MLKKRVFSISRPKQFTKSIRVTNVMWNAITEYANSLGISPNATVVMMLDEYLQKLMENNLITPPPDVVSQTATKPITKKRKK